jgi:hypothetical protein
MSDTAEVTDDMQLIDALLTRAVAIAEQIVQPQLRLTEDRLHEIVALLYLVLRLAREAGMIDALVAKLRNTTSTARQMHSPEMVVGYYVFPDVGVLQRNARALVVAALEILFYRGVELTDEGEIIALVRGVGLNSMHAARIKQRARDAAVRAVRREQSAHNRERRVAQAVGMDVEQYTAYRRIRQLLIELASSVVDLNPEMVDHLISEGVLAPDEGEGAVVVRVEGGHAYHVGSPPYGQSRPDR